MMDPSIIAAGVAVFNVALTIGGGGFFAGVTLGKVKRIEIDVKETKVLLITSAVEADRLRRAEADIHNVERTIDELRRGIGWVNDAGAKGLAREF